MNPFNGPVSNKSTTKKSHHRGAAATEELSDFQTPGRLIIIIALSVFNGELLIMIALYLMPPFPLYTRAIIDSSMLVLILSPVLYIYVFRPLVWQFNEFKRTQKALRESELQLIQADKMSSLGMLVSATAHELQNPNGVFILNLPILKDYLNELLPLLDRQFKAQDDCIIYRMSYREIRQDIIRLIDNLSEGSKEISSFINNLKDFSRYNEEIKLERANLKSIVDQVLLLCGTLINKTIHSFKTDIPDDLALVYTDMKKLKQILLNLLINAAQSADKNPSTLTLRAVSSDQWREHTIIEISDNGCGMDDLTRQKIFEPFFTTKSETNGTGLGLYICYNLVNALGGRIEVESEIGKGSTFRVIVPNHEQQDGNA